MFLSLRPFAFVVMSAIIAVVLPTLAAGGFMPPLQAEPAESNSEGIAPAATTEKTSPTARTAACLVNTYGEFIDRVEESTAGTFIVMKDNSRFIIDDGQQKTFEEMLYNPDLEDQLAIPYPIGQIQIPVSPDFDPGRARVTEFFKSLYGRTPREVESNLAVVDWPSSHGTKKVRFNRYAGAAEALSRAAQSLKKLDETSLKTVQSVGGTFNHRVIDGTDRLSAHAFGIAVDLDVKHSAYWRWSKTFPQFSNNISQAVIDIFEQNKFIWGGKWYHFDTMHFEYRPELFCNSV
jgi:hypothetical protein